MKWKVTFVVGWASPSSTLAMNTRRSIASSTVASGGRLRRASRIRSLAVPGADMRGSQLLFSEQPDGLPLDCDGACTNLPPSGRGARGEDGAAALRLNARHATARRQLLPPAPGRARRAADILSLGSPSDLVPRSVVQVPGRCARSAPAVPAPALGPVT